MMKFCITAALMLLTFNLVPIPTTMAVPAGFSTFFSGASCPDGWGQYAPAQGRLIVAQTVGGVTVNTPLSPQEDRTHSHSFSGGFNLPAKEISADSCCDDQGAKYGIYNYTGTSEASTSGLPFTNLVFCSLNGSNTDPVPYGTVGYFTPEVKSCPAGWTILQSAVGRTIIPGYTTTGITVSSSPPLSSGEDPPHTHPFSVSITLTDVQYAGIAGCCNNNLTPSGTVSSSGTTGSSGSGLPYLELLACVSQNETFSATGIPPETLLYNEVGCPDGWGSFDTVSGRFPVANPSGGTPGASFGGNSIPAASVDEGTHTHTIASNITTTDMGIGLAAGCCANGYGKNQEYSFSATSGASKVDFPYVMLPLCIQEAAKAKQTQWFERVTAQMRLAQGV